MTETNEPTREQIEKNLRESLNNAAVMMGTELEAAFSRQARMAEIALRTLDAEAQLSAMTERAERAERERGATSAALNDLADELGLPTNQMIFIGDDVVDLPAMRLCGLSFAPSDALPMVKREAGIVTECAGGRGCVREAIEEILRRVGKFDEVMARYVE